MSKKSRRFPARVRHWARLAQRRIADAPRWILIAGAVVVALFGVAAINLAYQVIRKPSELFFVVGRGFYKEPAETWRHYGPLFRTYATRSISPELLAAIAQTESTGNPVERTYWRWRFSYNPFEIYQRASSAVGLFQTTDPNYAEVVRYCIREKEVTDIGCGVGPYIRVMPSHAVELASIYLDRNLAAVLTRTGIVSATPKQEEDLAVIVHLRGGGPATAYARRRFQQKADERCGDHLVSAYMSKINTM